MTAQPNKSLDASGGGVFLNLLGAAAGALIRAAASTQPLYRRRFWENLNVEAGLAFTVVWHIEKSRAPSRMESGLVTSIGQHHNPLGRARTLSVDFAFHWGAA